MQFKPRKDTIILLPETLDKKLKALARVRDETFGCIIYSVRQDKSYQYILAATIYTITGGYSPDRTTIDESVKAVPQRFCGINPNFGFFEFHTHPLGSDYFSNADKIYFEQELRKNPFYMHLLVTPHSPPHDYILYKSPRIRSLSIAISEVPANFEKVEKEIHQDLERIDKELENPRQRIGSSNKKA